MDKLIQNKTIKNTILLLFFFFSCICCYFSIDMIFNIIGGAFLPLQEYLPFVITYALVVAYFFLFYKNNFVKKSKNLGLCIFVIITIASKILAISILSMHFQSALANFKYHTVNLLYPFDIIIISIIEFFVDFYIVYNVMSRRGNTLYIIFKDNLNIPLKFICGFVMVLAMFYIGAFFNGFYAIKNITYTYGFGYAILMLMFIAPAFTISSILISTNKKRFSSKTQLFGFTLSLFTIVSFVTYKIIYPSFEVEVGKPLLTIDFFGSMSIGTTITLIINLLITIRFIVLLIKNKHQRCLLN